MTDLPIDPSEYPGTPEYQEIQEQRKQRRELALLYQIEEDKAKQFCRHA